MWRRKRYKKSPSFLSIHIGVRAEALPAGTQCHHIIVEDWARMEEPFGTLFVSIPTLLDPSLSPDGTHIVHVFSPDWIDNWKVRSALPCFRVCECRATLYRLRILCLEPALRRRVDHVIACSAFAVVGKRSGFTGLCFLPSAGAQCGRVRAQEGGGCRQPCEEG